MFEKLKRKFHHSTENIDADTKAYLSQYNCDMCGRHCQLDDLHCGGGADKQREMIEKLKQSSN